MKMFAKLSGSILIVFKVIKCNHRTQLKWHFFCGNSLDSRSVHALLVSTVHLRIYNENIIYCTFILYTNYELDSWYQDIRIQYKSLTKPFKCLCKGMNLLHIFVSCKHSSNTFLLLLTEYELKANDVCTAIKLFYSLSAYY